MSGSLRISAAEVTSVALPVRGQLRHSDEQMPPHAVRHILRLRTDAGVTGVGDASPRLSVPGFRAAADQLVGRDPFNLADIGLRLMSEKFYRMELANIAAAVQMACLDIQGKVAGQPASALLGGQLTDRVPVIGYLFRKVGVDGLPDVLSDAELLDEAGRLVRTYGCRTLKYKAGVLRPEADIATSFALREAFDAAHLRVDPNAAWSVPTALSVARALDSAELEWLEDPTSGQEAMAEVNARTTMPTATNMCCIQPKEFPSAARLRAFDVMLLDLWYLGGPASARRMAETCRTFGIGTGVHAGGGSSETAIGLAAQAHLAASLPGLVHAMDTMNHELTDDLVTQPWQYADGALLLPDAPGLGVELDEDKLARYARAYEQRPETAPRTVGFPSYPIF